MPKLYMHKIQCVIGENKYRYAYILNDNETGVRGFEAQEAMKPCLVMRQ